MPALRTCLTGESGGNPHNLPTSIYRFESKEREKLRPSNVVNTAGQIPASHTADVQVLMGNQVILSDELGSRLVVEVQPLPSHFTVNLSNPLDRFLLQDWEYQNQTAPPDRRQNQDRYYQA